MSYTMQVVKLKEQLENIVKHQTSLIEEDMVICLLGEKGLLGEYNLEEAKAQVKEHLEDQDKNDIYQDLPFATITGRNGEPKEYKVVSVMKSKSKEADYKFLIHSEEELFEFEVAEAYDLNISSYNLATLVDEIT